MKKIAAFLTMGMLMCSVASAELTSINSKFLKDFKKGVNTLEFLKDNEVRDFENEEMKIHVGSVQIQGFQRGSTGNMRKNFIATHPDGLYHATQAAFGGNVVYFSATGVELEFTNKTNEVLYIDLNKSVITIGNYQGRPVVGGIKLNESQTANLPPIVIMPQKTVSKILYRGDSEFVNDGALYGSGWVSPCDLSLGKNIFGDGTFLIAVGDEKAKFVPMNFYREISRASIEQYIDQKK